MTSTQGNAAKCTFNNLRCALHGWCAKVYAVATRRFYCCFFLQKAWIRCFLVFVYSLGFVSYGLFSCDTRRKQQNNSFLQRVERKQAQKSLTYAGPKIWNQIPKQIKEMKMFQFKEGLKTFIYQRTKRAIDCG